MAIAGRKEGKPSLKLKLLMSGGDDKSDRSRSIRTVFFGVCFPLGTITFVALNC